MDGVAVIDVVDIRAGVAVDGVAVIDVLAVLKL